MARAVDRSREPGGSDDFRARHNHVVQLSRPRVVTNAPCCWLKWLQPARSGWLAVCRVRAFRRTNYGVCGRTTTGNARTGLLLSGWNEPRGEPSAPSSQPVITTRVVEFSAAPVMTCPVTRTSFPT